MNRSPFLDLVTQSLGVTRESLAAALAARPVAIEPASQSRIFASMVAEHLAIDSPEPLAMADRLAAVPITVQTLSRSRAALATDGRAVQQRMSGIAL